MPTLGSGMFTRAIHWTLGWTCKRTYQGIRPGSTKVYDLDGFPGAVTSAVGSSTWYDGCVRYLQRLFGWVIVRCFLFY